MAHRFFNSEFVMSLFSCKQCIINTSYATLSSGILCVYEENTSDKWDIPEYTTRKCCVTILYHAIENTLTKFRRE